MPLDTRDKKILVQALYLTMTNNPEYSRRFKRDYMWDVLYRTLVEGESPGNYICRLRAKMTERQIDNLLVKIYDQYVKAGNLP